MEITIALSIEEAKALRDLLNCYFRGELILTANKQLNEFLSQEVTTRSSYITQERLDAISSELINLYENLDNTLK